MSAVVSLRPRLEARAESVAAPWSLDNLRGVLSELSSEHGGARLTLAFEVVKQAQHQGEPVAWVTITDTAFFPPDVAASGIDLAALPVVRLKKADTLARGAEQLLRSGAFGLLVVDLPSGVELSTPMQSRLLGLCQKHHTALLCLTEKPRHTPSLGSLVALRAHAERRRLTHRQFECRAVAEKDKRRAPGWTHAAKFAGPPGLF